MEYIIAFVIVVIYVLSVVLGMKLGMRIVGFWPTLWKRARRLLGAIIQKSRSWDGVPAPAAGAPPADDAMTPPVPMFDADVLASRLRQLFGLADAEIDKSAHARELARHPSFIEAQGLLTEMAVPLATVREYAVDTNWFYSCAALAALAKRSDRDDGDAIDTVLSFFDTLAPWGMHFALKLFLVAEPRPPAGAPLAAIREWWRDSLFVISAFREHFDERARVGDDPQFGHALERKPLETQDLIKAFLVRVSHPFAAALIESLETARLTNVDREFLTSFGRFWRQNPDEVLVEPEGWKDGLAAAEAGVLSARPRSLLASGEARVGKTALLQLLGRRLGRQGWTVFEAGGADLMAGQQWFGQLEGRIQRTVDELAAAKRLIWYIPDILQIAHSGTHQGQAASILDQILPAISAGRLIVWTEASAAGTARLLRLRPALRGTFEVVRLEPMDHQETRELAREFARNLKTATSVTIEPAAIDAALNSARQYLTASSLPGATLDLLKLGVGRRAKGGGTTMAAGDIFEALARLTGLPASILDNTERVDLNAARNYFTARVIGQDEAVEAILARIAMLKAGLNDPAKPIGVFLFAGPTGTGKTELAKTLAEFLFGSEGRMIRLDMSEFQTPKSTIKILGSGEAVNPTESLITLVRKQPFSVVLLDEFEKAHTNVWDLFLQVFDDGRLTDHLGQVADFRHCIIILTSNLGATSNRGARMGFVQGEDGYLSEQVLRAVGQTFRPEFQNRLDKVIVFRPLSREQMRVILKKELSRVLDRRGFKDREWAVEWEASALEFLLEKGFSPEMGARPLKRAIDQYLIAPLAATIVEKRFPEGDQFVFVRSDGHAIQAEFVDPDAEEAPARSAPVDGNLPPLPVMILAAQGTEAELDALAAEMARVEEALSSEDWEARKIELSAQMMQANFWSRSDRFATLAHLALIDRVRAAAETARAIKTRLDKGAERAGRSSRELISRIALQLYLVQAGIADVREARPIEVALRVEPAFERPGERKAAQAWCAQVLDMYRAWGRKRHMQLTEMPTDLLGGDAGLPLLLVSGFGAFNVLASERGLHVLELANEEKGTARAKARVRVAAAPLGDLSGNKLRQALKEALQHAEQPSAIVRRYRSNSAPLVRDLVGGWRSGRLEAVLAGDFDLIAASCSL